MILHNSNNNIIVIQCLHWFHLEIQRTFMHWKRPQQKAQIFYFQVKFSQFFIKILLSFRVLLLNTMSHLKQESPKQGGVFIPLKGKRQCVCTFLIHDSSQADRLMFGISLFTELPLTVHFSLSFGTQFMLNICIIIILQESLFFCPCWHSSLLVYGILSTLEMLH